MATMVAALVHAVPSGMEKGTKTLRCTMDVNGGVSHDTDSNHRLTVQSCCENSTDIEQRLFASQKVE